MSAELAPRQGRTSPLALAVAVGGLITIASLGVWVAAGAGYFWPGWVIIGCVCVVAPIGWWHHLGDRANTPRTRVWLHLDVTAAVIVLLLAIWAMSGAQGPWVFWPVFALVLLLGLHALIDLRAEVPQLQTRELQERVDTLSRTRRQAVDAQAAELRRIERDLHDGAQARLVALTMLLGRAEVELADAPHAAELVRTAREEASLAIKELRDLARGIAPPVLADRGLVAAAQSLTDRGPAVLTVSGPEDRRPPPAVENAAYFVLAEALTNAIKHAPDAAVRVGLALDPDTLVVEVTDDGPGGAAPSGTGLAGLRARVEALDGTFMLTSPPGGPTHLHVELPCA